MWSRPDVSSLWLCLPTGHCQFIYHHLLGYSPFIASSILSNLYNLLASSVVFCNCKCLQYIIYSHGVEPRGWLDSWFSFLARAETCHTPASPMFHSHDSPRPVRKNPAFCVRRYRWTLVTGLLHPNVPFRPRALHPM